MAGTFDTEAMSEESRSGGVATEWRVERVPADAPEPCTHDLVAAAIRVARGAGLSWGHINQVLAGRP